MTEGLAHASIVLELVAASLQECGCFLDSIEIDQGFVSCGQVLLVLCVRVCSLG